MHAARRKPSKTTAVVYIAGLYLVPGLIQVSLELIWSVFKITNAEKLTFKTYYIGLVCGLLVSKIFSPNWLCVISLLTARREGVPYATPFGRNRGYLRMHMYTNYRWTWGRALTIFCSSLLLYNSAIIHMCCQHLQSSCCEDWFVIYSAFRILKI